MDEESVASFCDAVVAPRGAVDRSALDAVMPQVYAEMRRLAAIYMSQERKDHTLQPTALVSETYLRLATQHSLDFTNRAQVIGVGAQMMRRILRNYDDQRRTNKRGGDVTIVCLSDAPEPSAAAMAFSEVDEVLNKLAALDERQAMVAELRIFGGLTIVEAAEYLGISVATANRDWASGRLWLAAELRPT